MNNRWLKVPPSFPLRVCSVQYVPQLRTVTRLCTSRRIGSAAPLNGGVHSASLHSLARSNQRIAFQGPMAAKWTRVHIPSPLLLLLLVPSILNVLKGAVQCSAAAPLFSSRLCSSRRRKLANAGHNRKANGSRQVLLNVCPPPPPSLPPSFPLINIERIKSKVISRHTHGNHRRTQDNSRQFPAPCRALLLHCSAFYYSSP